MNDGDEIKSSLNSNQILPSKREIKQMIESGEWGKLGDIFQFTPTFLINDGGHPVINWLCVPPPMVAILQQPGPGIRWHQPIEATRSSEVFKSVPKKKRRKTHPQTKTLTFFDQGGICHYCGNRIYNFKHWTIDHRIPLARGGSNARTNKVGCCVTCNNAKGPLTEDEYFATPEKDRKNKLREVHKMLDAYRTGVKVAS